MQQAEFNTAFLKFIRKAPTAFHAVESVATILEDNGFHRLHEKDSWHNPAPGNYFVTRNQSSLIAFTLSGDDPAHTGLRLIGAHTDSPCLKIKPNPLRHKNSYAQLGVEVYGGALLTPWFDRDLSIAGRVTCQSKEGMPRNYLLDFRRPVAMIPSLAIHLDREANNGKGINKQTDLVPLIMLAGNDSLSFNDILGKELRRQYPRAVDDEILAHELFCYDNQPPALVGVADEFLCGARIDNLLSCHAATLALVNDTAQCNAMVVLSDHEEVGSVSTSGAQGSFLQDVLARILPEPQARQMCKARSLLISADNAHAVHPNFADKHDAQHMPQLNQGPVIKLNANQRYSSNSITASFFRLLCKRARVNAQEFVTRSDIACGSTIGPLVAAATGIKTVDVGAPSLAMHSIRETTGSADAWHLFKVFNEFFAMSMHCEEWQGIAE